MRHRLRPRHLDTLVCRWCAAAFSHFFFFFFFSLLLSTPYKFPSKQKKKKDKKNDLLHEFLDARRTAHTHRVHTCTHLSSSGEIHISQRCLHLQQMADNGPAIERETRTVYRLKLNVTLWRRRNRCRRSIDQLNVSEKFKCKHWHTHKPRHDNVIAIKNLM